MAIGAEDWKQIDLVLTSDIAGASAVAELRRSFPGLSWTRCDASDVTEAPFRTYPRFEVHLLDNADHCVRITTDPQQATGLIVADRTAGS